MLGGSQMPESGSTDRTASMVSLMERAGPEDPPRAENVPGMSWAQTLREYRHSRCVMTPIASMLVLSVALLSLVAFFLQLPGVFIGLLLAPLMRRFCWFVEFIYPSAAARWGHILLMKWSLAQKHGRKSSSKANTRPDSANAAEPVILHSRAVEQRIEVVPGRVYIHPLPQLLDNIAYLVVCCPPEVDPSAAAAAQGLVAATNGKKKRRGTAYGNSSQKPSPSAPILAVLVDCGDAASALDQIEAIKECHYNGASIELRAVLSTHKHHDHTAGNKDLLNDPEVSKTLLGNIFGGAVERVPHCGRFVTNGSFIELPSAPDNNMNDVVEIECVAVPSHTRGSIVYVLRDVPNKSDQSAPVRRTEEEAAKTKSYLFTGDAMFSGGAGVAFEADFETPNERKSQKKKKSTSLVRAAAGMNSTERCFAEILVRALGEGDVALRLSPQLGSVSLSSLNSGSTDRMLILPGHEYTTELLLRQFDQSNEFAGQWTRMPPSVFFATASHYLVAAHRRSLPKNGKLLTVPSPVSRELMINPHYRSLHKRAEHLIHAIRVWHRYCCNASLRSQQSISSMFGSGGSTFAISVQSSSPTYDASKSQSQSPLQIPRNRGQLFTTMFADDLDAIISDLAAGRVTTWRASERLMDMKAKLDEPLVSRRPIPGTLPSDRSMYLGVVALVMLGSAPCALTVTDGVTMNVPIPVDNSDHILISKRRLIAVLYHLGLLFPEGNVEAGRALIHIIDLLWEQGVMEDLKLEEEAPQPASGVSSGDGQKINSTPWNRPRYNALDVESSPETTDGAAADSQERGSDELPLGLLKLTLYGAAATESSLKSRYCLPCGKRETPAPPAPNNMRRSNGELVRHDVAVCPICRDVVGLLLPRTARGEEDGGELEDTDVLEDDEVAMNQSREADEGFCSSSKTDGEVDGDGVGVEMEAVPLES